MVLAAKLIQKTFQICIILLAYFTIVVPLVVVIYQIFKWPWIGTWQTIQAMHIFIISKLAKIKLLKARITWQRVQLLFFAFWGIFSHLNLNQGILIHFQIIKDKQIVLKTILFTFLILDFEYIGHLLSPIRENAINLNLFVCCVHHGVAATDIVLDVSITRWSSLHRVITNSGLLLPCCRIHVHIMRRRLITKAAKLWTETLLDNLLRLKRT